jgi:hypothetical protein
MVHADRNRPGLLAHPHNPDGSVPEVTNDQIHDDPMAAARRALHLDVPCEQCGAEFSKPCRTASGRYIPPPKVHAPRLAACRKAAAAGLTPVKLSRKLAS